MKRREEREGGEEEEEGGMSWSSEASKLTFLRLLVSICIVVLGESSSYAPLLFSRGEVCRGRGGGEEKRREKESSS